MLKSSRRRQRRENEIDAALKNERAYRANGKPLIHQTSSPRQKVKGATLGNLSNIWPHVNTFKSTLY